MKRILISILGLIGLLTAPAAFAQNRTSFQGLTAADEFAYGMAAGSPALLVTSGSNSAGTYSLTLAYGRSTTGSGVTFTAVSTSAPITVGIGASLETVTPSSVSCTTPGVLNTCIVTATFAYAHNNGDLVRSGDFGLQEAAQYVVGKGGGMVTLSPLWFQWAGGHTAGLTALVTYRSLATTTYTVLDYSGIAGALSYAAASGSVYASTTHVLY
jgi:hypothetical protein